jgi:hypothetical protein
MLRKASIVLSVFAALGLAAAAPASAQQGHKNARVNKTVRVNKNVNVNKNVRVNRNVNVNRNVRVNRSVHSNYVVGRRYNGHSWYGRNRHRWHGAWYAYGVGPCWINVDGLWFWNDAACP